MIFLAWLRRLRIADGAAQAVQAVPVEPHHPALRGPSDRPLKLPVLHHPCLQPQADQLEHPPVRHPPPHLSEQPVMADLAEEVADIELRAELAALDEAGPKPFHRLRG